MSAWPELPRPATPGPWAYEGQERWSELGHSIWSTDPKTPPSDLATARLDRDAAAIAALPDYVAEVDRLRAWVEWLEGQLEELRWLSPRGAEAIRAGEWPEGREP